MKQRNILFGLFNNKSLTERLVLKLSLVVILLGFSVNSMAGTGSNLRGGASCLAIVSSGKLAESDLVRIYAGKGVVVPNLIECQFCGGETLMPASYADPRVQLNVDVDGERGATVECEGCGGHTPLWTLDGKGNPIGRARQTQLTPKMDEERGKRYVEVPPEYLPLGDPQSEMNQLARNATVYICPSCATTTALGPRFDIEGQSCVGCGTGFSPDRVFNTKQLLAEYQRNRETQRVREAVADSSPSSRSRILGRQTSPKEIREKKEQGRAALSAFAKKWLFGGATALAVLSSATYWYNDVPVVATGVVMDISANNVATVNFTETPYYTGERNLKTYQVDVLLDEMQSLPGDLPYSVQLGDVVSIHYEWADFHVLPFVFHPYTGIEMQDGSFVPGSGLN
ncbi:MAG: hypothetical protein KDD22_05095 [Bdellovibrionales bacterium]|nr:hypothetical protein [Bdellovibrionales bacterium]